MKPFIQKKYIFLLIFILFSASPPCSFTTFAKEPSDNIVRVGYYSGDEAFQDGFSDEKRKSGYAYEYYQKIAALTGWEYQYIYGTKTDVLEKLMSGEIDIVAGVFQTDEQEAEILFSKYDMGLDGEPRYFAVNPNRPELLDELNRAQAKLLASSPNFAILMQERYYNYSPAFQTLTEQEADWLAQKGSLKMGYVRSNLPLSDQDESGMPTGIAGELLNLIADYLNVPITPVCYDHITLMEEALRNGEIDVAFPIYSDLWLTETKGFLQTDSFISDRVMIAYQGSYRSDLMDKIALTETGVGQRYYLSHYYPDAETVFYDSRELVFQAIEDGEANCTVGCSSIFQTFFAGHPEFQDINIAYLDTSEDFGMAVNRNEYILAEILNKAINQLDDAVITNSMVKYSFVDTPYTFTEFIRSNAVAVVAVLAFFFAILLVVFISYRRKTNEFNAKQAKTCAALEDALNAAKAASDAKSTFLSNMSHDIRTPLNGIIGMTAIAEAKIDEPARVKDCLAKITSSGKHLLALINEVLDMSKIESGELSLQEESFLFSSLLDDLISLNRPQAAAKHHEMTVLIQNVTHEEVYGDIVRLQQVLTNLVSNAVKYTPAGGKIEIILSEKPSGKPQIGCFQFVVKDNGQGMSEEYLPHVFEAFTRADNTSSNRILGTGLGMPIARNIIRMMGGDITVKSVLGQGSTFTVTLFLKLKETDTAAPYNFAGLNVLVVDDDPATCESSCSLLSELGIKSEGVLSGKEAAERAGTRHKNGDDYFAILIDWKTTDMNHLETTREIRKQAGPKVPIAIISSYDWSAIEEDARAAGADKFIGKPLFRSRLVHLFEQLLGENSEKSESGLKELVSQTDFAGKRALLAEDNEINAEIAKEFLTMTGFSIDWVPDGKHAVEHMQASAPGYYDCIFMDVQMPVMNGIEATKAIRALDHPDAKTIPIFAMTANAFLEDVQMVLNAGMNEHIAKPLNFELVLDVLHRYLS